MSYGDDACGDDVSDDDDEEDLHDSLIKKKSLSSKVTVLKY